MVEEYCHEYRIPRVARARRQTNRPSQLQTQCWGEPAFDYWIPQDQATLWDSITAPQDEYGPVLVIVDQPNVNGALPVAVETNCGADIAYFLGEEMRKGGDL